MNHLIDLQRASSVLMIRPAQFGFNVQTAISNSFQQQEEGDLLRDINQKAQEEFDAFVNKLTSVEIRVEVVDDTPYPVKPDAIFPNNWVMFSSSGDVYLFPMATENRRFEKRLDIVEHLGLSYCINSIKDVSALLAHSQGVLEGTGSIVFDHVHAKAYACLSPRTHRDLFESFAQEIGYEPICFEAFDRNQQPIYHTNVVMSIGVGFVIVCWEAIASNYQPVLQKAFEDAGLEIISVDFHQMSHFACNALQVLNTHGDSFLVLSASSERVLTLDQKTRLSVYAKLLPIEIPTIERIGGGSVRCMMAEIFCPLRQREA